MSLVTINRDACHRDGFCIKICPAHLFVRTPEGFPQFLQDEEHRCARCGHCVAVCPHDSLKHQELPLDQSPLLEASLKTAPEALIQFMKSRRSVRAFKNQTVPEKLIRAIIDVTVQAPTSGNRQPVQWLIIREPGEVHRLAGLILEGMKQDPSHAQRLPFYVSNWEKGVDIVLRGAPHLAIAHAAGNDYYYPTDAAIALTYFSLAAHANGLGTCWTGNLTHTADNFQPLTDALALPAGNRVFGALMFGYPMVPYRRLPVRQAAKVEIR